MSDGIANLPVSSRIRNARPQDPWYWLADSVRSPLSQQSLLAVHNAGTLRVLQGDVFLTPRSSEKRYFVADNRDQFHSLWNDPDHATPPGESRGADQVNVSDTR